MKINFANIKKAKNYLDKGDCVAVPTETVYGLAGNAYSKKAVIKIYKLKKRPKINPLIVHYSNYQKASNDVIFNHNFFKLYKRFCPGPISFILKKKKKSKIHSLATAKLSTAAIRFPSNNIIRSILKKIDFPLVMPSANLSSGVSPVKASDIVDDFKKKIRIIINGGHSKIGIESTVVDLTGKPKILRPGIISSEILKKYININVAKKNIKIKSPGMLKKHYSPGIPMILNQKIAEEKSAFITFGSKYKNNINSFNLSKKADLKEAASNLYKIFRKIKKKGYKKICVTKIPNYGPGIAINDRLMRASK
jgi:L-threonylcarbamoyladenylate synthase